MKLRKRTALPLLDLESSSSGSEYESEYEEEGGGSEDEHGSSCPSGSEADSSEWETDAEGEQPALEEEAAEASGAAGLLSPGDWENEGSTGAVGGDEAARLAAGSRVPPAGQPQPGHRSTSGCGSSTVTGCCSQTADHPLDEVREQRVPMMADRVCVDGVRLGLCRCMLSTLVSAWCIDTHTFSLLLSHFQHK